MKAQGSRDDPKLHTRPPLARDGAKTGYSCTCIKTTPKSGQARRGLDGAPRGCMGVAWVYGRGAWGMGGAQGRVRRAATGLRQPGSGL